MQMQNTALERANEVVHAANLQDIYALERCIGEHDNEVWYYGPYLLRVHASSTALEREARLLRHLPPGIPHAGVVASGDGWLVQRRASGDPLSQVWSTLSESKRRAAAQQLAAILINLHQVRISGIASLSPGWFTAILPADILRLATQLRPNNPDLIDAVMHFTRQTMAEVTPPLRWGFIHRDLHFDHVLWSGDRITALLDFESAVLAPRELELEMLVRFCRYPSLYGDLKPHDLEMLPGWLMEVR